MSREKKFTPGPWEIMPYSDEDIDISVCHGLRKEGNKTIATWIADLNLENTGDSFDEFEANANLISAAPELLEALEKIENDDNQMPKSAWQLIQNAIAKAYGEQS